jgi:hypothetical protein
MDAVTAEEQTLPEGACCLTCGYALGRLQEARCPECGDVFNPADPATFRNPRFHPIRYFWTTPPPTWHVVSILAATCVLIVAASAPHFGTAVILASRPPLTSLALVTLVAVVLDYLKRLAQRWRRAGRRRWRTARTRSPAWRWAVTPLSGLLLASAVLTDWPLRLRFALSQSAFLEAMSAYYQHPDRPPRDKWIGWYRVRMLQPHGDGVVLNTREGHDEALGFAYSPSGTPPAEAGETLRPIAPSWFVYSRR